MATVIGNHPYADKFPMASDDELSELTASIQTSGLIHPIVLTPEGYILDGRNRFEACKRAGVDPTFTTREGDDDDYKEFVIGVNTTGRRESMTVQIAAASTALILGHEKRVNGQWKRGSVPVSTESRTNTWQDAIRQAGTVLDVLGPAYLEAVRDGESTLNHVYEQARMEQKRQEEAEVQRLRDIAERESEVAAAKELFNTDPEAQDWLTKQGDEIQQDLVVARTAFERANAEAWRKRKEQERRQEQERRDYIDACKRDADRLKSWLNAYDTAYSMRSFDETKRVDILKNLNDRDAERFKKIEKETSWPAQKI